MDDSMDIEVVNVGIEKKFVDALSEFSQSQDPFDIIRQFRDISSTKAIQIKDELLINDNEILQQEFESWQLETKLWHLVEILYSFRLSNIELNEETEFSSVAIKEENFRRSNKRVAELGMIIDWVQYNSESVDTSVIPWVTKWKHTMKYVETKDLNVLIDQGTLIKGDYITEFDVDAPIRQKKSLHPEDLKNDDIIFQTIYELILVHNYDEALSLANETGNYTLSMILFGDILPYLDPIIDEKYMKERGLEFNNATGCKHKLLWYKSVYKLAQQPNINKYERMIYNYLSGSNIGENLKSSSTWDKWLLLYCNQLMIFEILKFYETIYNSEENLDIKIIKPQTSTIESILNNLSKSDNSISEMSRHPLRIITGGIMINKITPLVSEVVKSHKDNEVFNNQSLLRILVHLTIFLNSVELESSTVNDFTKLISLYISKLSENGLQDLIPVYLSFIPNEIDAIEIYSNFLLSIRDKDQRTNQIKIAKRIPYFIDQSDSDNLSEDRLSIFLRKTVEKILKKTEPYYQPTKEPLIIKDDIESVEDIDRELFESVEWFLANSMNEDIIVVSIIIIKRLLICGKLAALKEFSINKNFKRIINNYDNDLSTKKLLQDENSREITPIPSISDESKEELLNYDLLIKGLISINEWKKFIEENGKESKSFSTKDVENSIEKTTKQIYNLIMNWLVNSHDELLKELRNLYVPYLIIELLQIYEFARLNNWDYLQKAFELIKQVANEDENDLLNCFISSGKLNEFLIKCGKVSLIASEKGVKGIFV
ncbi:nucleoporin Nup84p [[Candida] jaroonii]|uniref:Nucleoporin Nup84p n=1 Tax=[Candida] jaroonii TaxID=467808 RepID=A0ACA9YDZ0_9ASCO|nr:nucleoporin Nup84p [[Candida] jaroonii]